MGDSPEPDQPYPWKKLLLLWLFFMALAWIASEIGLRLYGHTRR